MLGAITGDIIGSVYEQQHIKFKDFPLFSNRAMYTDDSVTTIAVAHAILNNSGFAESLKYFGQKYPAGYGYRFGVWLESKSLAPYDSWGNGSGMRVSPVAWAYNDESTVLQRAEDSAAVTHNHPEGIKGAQAIALAIFLARTGSDKETIRSRVTHDFNYDLDRSLDSIRPGYRFDVSSAGSVPESIIAFLESTDLEDAIRNAVSLGGDADTMACMAGSIAEAFYGGVPEEIATQSRTYLGEEFIEVLDQFTQTHMTDIYPAN